MKRILTVTVGVGIIVGALCGVSAAMYWVGYLMEGLFRGGSNVANIIFLVLVMVMVIATFLTLAERKWSALMQDRVGPNRARIGLPGLKNASLAGIPHIGADVLKMLWKEDFIPAAAKENRFLYNLGPMLAFAPVFVLFAVVPVGPTVIMDGRAVHGFISDPNMGLLYIFAIASLAVYGTALAGWASNNKFALLGGVRASAQMISYEVALGLGLVGAMMAFQTIRLTDMSNAQFQYLWVLPGVDVGLPMWGIFLQPIGFLIFFVAAFAETKRAPFDAPEGESEIIGYFVEYSGMKFGLFMISEFVEVVVLSAISVAIFFGAWNLPIGQNWLYAQFHDGGPLGDHTWLYGTILATVFWIKVLLLSWFQLAIRWTFPRFRYDQIQTLGWKMLLPLGIANVFISGALLLWGGVHALALFGLLVIATVVAVTVLGGRATPEPGHGHDHGHAAATPSGH
jgi:NADH-quinone oxidoreductase subunit H